MQILSNCVEKMVAVINIVNLVLLAIPPVYSYSFGAGGCNGGGPAVGGPHLSSPSSGSLATGGFQVTLDSTPLTPGTATSFVTGQDHVLTLKVNTASFFKGVLFRLGSTNGVTTTSALAVQSGDSNLRLASETCISEGVGGVTHTSNSQKVVATVTLRLNSVASALPLDITVVVQNSGGSSVYYYSGFTLNAVLATGVTNPSPTPLPTMNTTPRPVTVTVKPVTQISAPATLLDQSLGHR